MHEVISLAEPARWEQAYARLGRQDVFFRHAYARLCASLGEGEPWLFAYEGEAGGRVGYVFVRRPLAGLPLFADAGLEEGACDLITPDRGYGGPLTAGASEAELRGFRAAFEAYCRQTRVVSEFVRFHPLLGNHRGLEGAMDVRLDRESVVVELDVPEDALLGRIHDMHRRRIRKAERSGLAFDVQVGEEAQPHLDTFYALYRATMDKLGAAPHAYYSAGYLHRLYALLADGALLARVTLEGRMLAGAVCLREGGVLHFHMGASEQAALPLGPNVLLFQRLALWGQRAGCHALHLGPGHVGRDSLFMFKYRFNPEGLRAFHVGRKVHAPRAYAQLVEAWRRHHGGREPPAHYFPAYRAELDPAAGWAAPGSAAAPLGSEAARA